MIEEESENEEESLHDLLTQLHSQIITTHAIDLNQHGPFGAYIDIILTPEEHSHISLPNLGHSVSCIGELTSIAQYTGLVTLNLNCEAISGHYSPTASHTMFTFTPLT